MIDRTVVARLLFTAPRTADRLRARTLLARQSLRPTVTLSTEEVEALTNDLEQLAAICTELRQRLREMRQREVSR